MDNKTKLILNCIGLILIGVGLGLIIMTLMFPSAEQLIYECNNQFGAGNWNVTLIKDSWYCTGLEVQYFDVELP